MQFSWYILNRNVRQIKKVCMNEIVLILDNLSMELFLLKVLILIIKATILVPK